MCALLLSAATSRRSSQLAPPLNISILLSSSALSSPVALLAQVPGRARASCQCWGTAPTRSGAGRALLVRVHGRAPPNHEIRSSAYCLRALRLSRRQGAGRGGRLFLPCRAAAAATSGGRSRTKLGSGMKVGGRDGDLFEEVAVALRAAAGERERE